MDSHRVGHRVLIGLASIALVAGCAGSGPFASRVSPTESTPASPAAPSRANPGSTPSGWTSVTSPWLGYSVAMPATWALADHVVSGDSRSPHDVYTGTVGGSDGLATLVIGYCPSGKVTATGAVTEDLTVDGVSFDIVSPTVTDAGRNTLFATGVQGDRTWYLMACMPDDAESRAFFRQVVATFRFPGTDFAEPPQSALSQ